MKHAAWLAFLGACAGAPSPSSAPSPPSASHEARIEPAPTPSTSMPAPFETCAVEPDEALRYLRALAFDGGAHDVALRASVTYLEALNAIAIRTSRDACFDAIAGDAPQLADRHCPADRSPPEDEASCALLAGVTCDVQALLESRTTRARARDGVGAARRFANAKMALWRRFGAPRVRRGLTPWCRMEWIVYDAMRGFRAANDEDDAAKAAAILREGWPGMPSVYHSSMGPAQRGPSP